WEVLLLNQFHDILPGSSIKEVYDDSAQQFKELFVEGEKLLKSIAGEGKTLLNTTGVSRVDVIRRDGKLQFVQAQPFAGTTPVDPADRVTIERKLDSFVLTNENLIATFKSSGELTSLAHRATGRESLAEAGNVFEIYDDT